ncbi:MAG: RES family NAD+ phosphorylase [Bacteroidales bacterium]|nr:RES family NAD+ phosphorylase [Candidatus Colicola caccequi]
MLVSPNCFKDQELKAEMNNNISAQGICEISGEEGNLADISILQNFFNELLSLFSPTINGFTIDVIITREWGIFKSQTIARTVLAEILRYGGLGYGIDTLVDYREDLQEEIAVWSRLKKEVCEQTRFFANTDRFATGKYLQLGNGLQQGQKLYRARIIPNGRNYLTKHDMGCPPKEYAKAGRANPLGIPYLYLCQSPETTYYEVRALHLDKLSVGTFEVQRDLKIVDFNDDTNLFVAFCGDDSLKDVVVRKKINEAISADMSKPLRRYDSEIEYVPTQLICEWCKLELQADGICFKSSLHDGGVNYVLFNNEDAQCIIVHKHQVGSISIKRKK